MSQQRALGLQPQAITAALPEDTWDPLRHEDADPLWREIEPFFSPITIECLGFLREGDSLNNGPDMDLVNPVAVEDARGTPSENGGADVRPLERRRRRLESSGSVNSLSNSTEKWTAEQLVRARLNSYPFFQRVSAAFVESPGTAEGIGNALRNKGSGSEDLFWGGPAAPEVMDEYYRILEKRVCSELGKLGLIAPSDVDEVQQELRLLQWQLRTAKARSRSIRSWSCNDWNRALKAQGKARELEQGNQNLQILYLERAIRKCRKNRRMRQRFERVLKLLFPSHRIGNLQLQRRNETGSGGQDGHKQPLSSVEDSPIGKS
jgi:hypothetical protein